MPPRLLSSTHCLPTKPLMLAPYSPRSHTTHPASTATFIRLSHTLTTLACDCSPDCNHGSLCLPDPQCHAEHVQGRQRCLPLPVQHTHTPTHTFAASAPHECLLTVVCTAFLHVVACSFDHIMSFSAAAWGANFTQCDDKVWALPWCCYIVCCLLFGVADHSAAVAPSSRSAMARSWCLSGTRTEPSMALTFRQPRMQCRTPWRATGLPWLQQAPLAAQVLRAGWWCVRACVRCGSSLWRVLVTP